MGRNKFQVNITRLVAMALALLLILPLVPAVSAAEASGSCGSGVNWTLSSGVLTISGSGDMADYSELTPAPWHAYKDSILAVVVQEGVTGVGGCAFFKLEKLKSVRLASSVKSIGDWAFYYCSALEIADLGGVTKIGQSAFERCLSLTGVRLPSTLQTLEYHAFYRCENLLSITVPASVTNMETSVFAYCVNLRSANILASISELPLWTFYGCEALQSVSLTSNITSVGTQAFHNCDSLSKAVYGGSQREIQDQMPQVEEFIAFVEPEEDDPVEVTTTVTEEHIDGTTVTTDWYYTSSASSSVDMQTTRTEDAVTVKIDAVLENAEGWQDVIDRVQESSGSADAMEANIWLKGDSVVSGEDIGRFAGLDVKLIIHTTQGAEWYINGNNLKANDLADDYNISYTLRKLTDLNKDQTAALDGHAGYILEFHGVLDFKVEVELPIGKNYNRQSAVFFSPEENGYQRKQAVMIDDEGMAHFYLAQVDAEQEYLIGINVPQKVEEGSQSAVSDVIIPDSMKNEYPNLEQTEEITYIVTGVKSSLGINIGQLTFFLIAGMIICAVVVGVVMRILYKQKLKSGYTPDMRYTDEV